LLSWLIGRPARAGDPYVEWYTLESPHYRVHFHAGIEPIAQKVAVVAERAHEALTPQIGFVPSTPTEIVLTDDSEVANGLASPLPYPSIVLLVSAPDDMSSLGDYDDWVTELVTHELTHILQLSNTSGLPGVYNRIFGPTYAPNQEQPHWIIEGLAVAMETEHTTGGRLRGTQFDMFLRADVLAGRIARLDEISHPPRRYPGGTLWYLYGAKFVAWISSIYGPDIYAAVAADYGAQVLPWGINRAIRRATGRTYEELYAGFIQDIQRSYRAQARAVESRGLREGRRLTHHGYTALEPRFLPAACGTGPKLSYVREDADSPGGVYTIPLDGSPISENEELVARSTGRSHAWGPDCSLYFDGILPSRRLYGFNDISRLAPGERSPRGTEKNRERLTFSRRARDIDVSPDGRKIVYATNDRGTTTLRLATLTGDHRLTDEWRLVASGRFEQVFTPRFSPDGRRVAFGTWTAGGYRDIRIVDIETGALVELFRDRAIDQQPAWSPDGKTLYFTSDRTGIANVYAWDVETGALRQVTNVVNGAYMPAVSPDGRRLVYVGFTPDGFDLYEMELDPSRFLPALPAASVRSTVAEVVTKNYAVSSYRALPTLWPRRYLVTVEDTSFGPAIRFLTAGADAVGYHGVSADLSIATQTGDVLGSVSYGYGRLPFGFFATAFRNAAVRPDFRFGETARDVTEHQSGVTTGVDYGIPGVFDAQGVALSYTLAHWEHERPFDPRVNPNTPVPVEPPSGTIGIVRLAYEFSNASATPMAISLERGLSLSVAGDFADGAWGSEDTLTAFSGVLRGYFPLPWHPHHVLAVALSGGAAVGSYARFGAYSTGGYGDAPEFTLDASFIRESSFVLRGYAPGQFSGSTYNLLNVEYRFPILYVDRGISTLPAFLRTLSGALFFDWGGAYNAMNLRRPTLVLHPSAGAELSMDFVLGYFTQSSVKLGIARGFDSHAMGWDFYFAAAAGF
jgi:hypothetical protein